MYAATNAFVPVSSWLGLVLDVGWYCALAVLICCCVAPETALFRPESVTVKSLRMPLPVMPGLQAGTYLPAGTLITRSRERPGPTFSTSPTMRSPSLP